MQPAKQKFANCNGPKIYFFKNNNKRFCSKILKLEALNLVIISELCLFNLLHLVQNSIFNNIYKNY